MAGTGGNQMNRLKEIIQVIDRPLAFAERGGTVALKDLGRFISRQVTDALAEHVRPSAIEAELLRLAQLFTDYEQLSPGMRAARVAEARAVIVRLDQTVDAPPPTPGRPANRLSDYPVQYIRGVGPKKAEALGRIGIRTVEDAVWMLPWRYEDRSQCRSISSLVPGEAAMIEAQVERTALKVTNFKRRKLVEVAVADPTGRLHLIWFNQAYLAETFHVGQRVMLYGQVKPRNGRWTDLQMENPVFEILEDAPHSNAGELTHMGRIVPIYHARETKSRMMLSDRLRAMMKIIVDQYGQDVLEPLPLDMLRRRKLLSFGEALRQVHFPRPGADLEELNRGRSPAHRRLAFEDFLLLELALGQKREGVKKESRVLTYDLASSLPALLLMALPFRLTTAQLRVLQEIRQDLASRHP